MKPSTVEHTCTQKNLKTWDLFWDGNLEIVRCFQISLLNFVRFNENRLYPGANFAPQTL